MSLPARIHPLQPSTEGNDRWAWLPERDRGAAKVAEHLMRESAKSGYWSVACAVLTQVKGRDLGSFEVEPYWKTWMGWGVTNDVLCAALAVVSRKSRVSDPVALCHHLIEQYARAAGIVQPEQADRAPRTDAASAAEEGG